MERTEQQTDDDAYAEVWRSFEKAGRTTPAFADLPTHEGMLHLVFLIPLGETPGLPESVAPLQDRLRFPYADLVPPDKLHVSIQGFDVSKATWMDRGEEVIAAAEGVFAGIAPFTLRVGCLNSFRMAAFLRVEDGGMIRRLRAALRAALPAWTGVDQDRLVRYGRDGWLPHMSLAYYRAEHDNRELVEAIAPVREQEVLEASVNEVHLVSTPPGLQGPERWVWPVHAVFELGQG